MLRPPFAPAGAFAPAKNTATGQSAGWTGWMPTAPAGGGQMYGVTNTIFQGKIKSFNEKTGFGFITCETLAQIFGGDVFLHERQLGTFQVGQIVNFQITMSKQGKPQAYNLIMPREVPGVTDKIFEGHIKSFNEKNGFGFITCEPLAKMFGGDVFLHERQLGTCQIGQIVNFRVALSKQGKPQAYNVELPKELPGITDNVFEGHIKSFNTESGYGFISCVELAKQFGGDVFLHSSQLGDCQVGQAVSFEVTMNKQQKPQAHNVVPAGDADGAGFSAKRQAPDSWTEEPQAKWNRTLA